MDARMLEPNSHRYKEEKVREEEKPEKVVSGKVTLKKKPWWSKFINEDMGSIGNYIVEDTLIPRIKQAIVDIITGSTERIFGVGKSRYYSGSSYRSSNVDYHDKYRREAKRESNERQQRRDLKDIILERREDAEEVRDQLEAMIDQYGTASVADLWDFLGVEDFDFTDNYYGWYAGDVKHFGVHYVGNGYRLSLPKPTVTK